MDVVEVEVTVWYCGGGGGAESQHSLSGNSLAAPRSNRAIEVTSRKKRGRKFLLLLVALLALALVPVARRFMMVLGIPSKAIGFVVVLRLWLVMIMLR